MYALMDVCIYNKMYNQQIRIYPKKIIYFYLPIVNSLLKKQLKKGFI